jgi:hypothetical protein
VTKPTRWIRDVDCESCRVGWQPTALSARPVPARPIAPMPARNRRRLTCCTASSSAPESRLVYGRADAGGYQPLYRALLGCLRGGGAATRGEQKPRAKQRGLPDWQTPSVARAGFEPAISALRGRCPWPLDERAMCASEPRCESPLAAAGLGFEPRLTDPESAVLPLDDPARLAMNIADRSGRCKRRWRRGAEFLPRAPPLAVP